MEESTKSIQHEIGEVYTDALRFGFHGVKSDILELHPLQSAKKNEEKVKKKVLANTYGSAFPIKLGLHRQILTMYVFIALGYDFRLNLSETLFDQGFNVIWESRVFSIVSMEGELIL